MFFRFYFERFLNTTIVLYGLEVVAGSPKIQYATRPADAALRKGQYNFSLLAGLQSFFAIISFAIS